ncbi:MAG TPA: glycosyl hydrolase [bacterium]|nr:glycosyl hydrolase [bacterium]HQG47025.1 glycosyl hydrolase [bacterium]HQI49197.1 glycosyl hydrolase [bacterium]HQJ64102.1 glycosyl hydrolase [bacterium]
MKRMATLSLLALLVLVSGCKDKSPTKPDTGDAATKSWKRGIAFNLATPADFAALSKGVSWWYNWAITPSSSAPAEYETAYDMDFVPMLWGGNTSATDITRIKAFVISHPKVQYILVMNEPNLTNQANRTPGEAAADWIRYEQVVRELADLGRTVHLVGPAMTWGTMAGYADPVVWLDAFLAAYKTANNGREPQIDYLAFHWYDYGLAGQLDRLKKYNKKIWVTEMANWNSQINSYAKQIQQMTEMVTVCENRADVFRYAWFYGRGGFPDTHYTYVFTANDGELSVLGEHYLGLPFKK